MNRISYLVFFTVLLSAPLQAGAHDDTLFTAILMDHVVNGAVNYTDIAKDERLDTYLGQLAETKAIELPSREAQLAFWINAYNAYTLKLVASVPAAESITEITGLGTKGDADTAKPWDQAIAEIGGETYTLNHIENEIIRPEFNDARIHFALVCAAYSCPQLRNEAYVPDRLNEQLNEQGRHFMTHRNVIDPRTRTAQLSQIFKWFDVDFGSDEKELLRYLADFVEVPAANSLRNEARRWTVSYSEYVWSLNDRP